jgi:hypothetical protein
MTTFLAIILPVVVVATWIVVDMTLRARRERRPPNREPKRSRRFSSADYGRMKRQQLTARSGSIDVARPVVVRMRIVPDEDKETQP